MSDRQTLMQAIATLESQRGLLGDSAVDTALWALRQNLAAMPTPGLAEVDEEHQQLTVLIADLVGFTALSSEIDAEQVRDGLDALWQQLDAVITAWGGKIDQHVGDSVIAHFGLPYPRDDDPERAIQAALEMNLTLSWLNQSNGRFTPQFLFTSNTPLQMRIGIHTGPVLLGRIGRLAPFTAVGDTVTIAETLEKAAPVGGILISDVVQRFVRGRFDLVADSPLQIPDTHLHVPTYVVANKSSDSYADHPVTHSQESPPLVGRSAELEQLQNALQLVFDSHVAQFVLITGESGLGKTRLLAQFERWTSFYAGQMRLIRGRVYAQQPLSPYALLDDIISGYFDIRVRHNKLIVRDKLVDQMVTLLSANGLEEITAQRYIYAIGQLLGFDFSLELAGLAVAPGKDWLREQALAGLLALVTAATATGNILILCLEDLHDAGEPMLSLIEALLSAGQDLPLLVVSTTLPHLPAQRHEWTDRFIDPFSPYEQLILNPLSPIDSRHLVNERLHQLPQVPIRLTDLIVSVTGGHPLGIEEMIGFLLDNNVIVDDSVIVNNHIVGQGASRWRLQMGQLENLRVPSNVRDLLHMRVAQMPEDEQVVLRRAAVFGGMFADAAVAQLGQADDHYLTDNQLEAALIILEKRGIVFRSPTMSFADAQDFVFSYELWRQAADMGLAPDLRRAYHAQAAYWIIAKCSQQQLTAYAPTIADHFTQADDSKQAALWYGRS